MRTLMLLLVGAVVALAADDEAVNVLARLIDHEKEPVRARVLAALENQGLEGLPLLELVLQGVTTPAGKNAVETLFSKHRDRMRKDPHMRLPDALSEKILWRLCAGRTAKGKRILYCAAHTFVGQGRGFERLRALEYLACPMSPGWRRPAKHYEGKSYESLAGMYPDEWQAFAAVFRADRSIFLRWFSKDGQLRSVALEKMLPWAKPRALEESGLMIGNNHDERENALLPPHETAIQIGVVLP